MTIKLKISAAIVSLALAVPATAKTMIVVLPEDYSGPREELVRLAATEASQLATADRLLFIEAANRKQAATVVRPQGRKAANPAWVRTKIAEQFAVVRRAIEGLPPSPPVGAIPANLHIPEALGDLGRNLLPSLPEKSADILLIGNPLYFDPRDGRFAMADRYYPSDAHIRARPSETPYGTAGRETLLAGATIHMCMPRDEFVTKDHEEAVRRFWSLWIAAQGGRLGTFGFDLAQCFERMRKGEASGQEAFTLTPGTKLEMLRAHAPIPAVLPATTDRPGEYFLHDNAPISTTPPAVTSGIAWIGLRWKVPADIDLYTRRENSRPWLYFANTQSPDGRFNKDHRSATGDLQFEFVEFLQPIDLAKAQVAINLYEGNLSAAPEGQIRVWFDRKIYEAPWKIAATRGNGGAPPMSGPNWITIDLRKVVGLPSP
ncbi:MAG: hypothetical protein KIT82_07030 [Bradyrhizobium sp.]|nr:hypothetical protein [Bradyrhizobium sp.]